MNKFFMRKEAYVRPKKVEEVMKNITDILDQREAIWNLAKIPGSARFIDRLGFAFRNGAENRKLREELINSTGRYSLARDGRAKYYGLLDKLHARNTLKENPLNIYTWAEGMGAHPKATLATAITAPTALYVGDKVLDKALD